jgi:hypothetical protein
VRICSIAKPSGSSGIRATHFLLTAPLFQPRIAVINSRCREDQHIQSGLTTVGHTITLTLQSNPRKICKIQNPTKPKILAHYPTTLHIFCTISSVVSQRANISCFNHLTDYIPPISRTPVRNFSFSRILRNLHIKRFL